MNKNLHLLMQVLFVFTALTLFSCSKEQSVPDNHSVERNLTFTASFADSGKSKTELQSDGKVWWSPGDAISVFYGSGNEGGNKFVAQNEETAAIANFTGTIGVITGGGEIALEDTYFWASYPYNSNTSCDGQAMHINLPSEQQGKVGTFADGMFPTIARSQGLQLSFYNICGGIKFSVVHSGVGSVTFTAIGGEDISGDITVTFENGVPKITDIKNGSNEVTVFAPNGESFEVGEYYYVILPPVCFSQGIKVNFCTWYEEAERTVSSSVTINRSMFKLLTNADQKCEYKECPYARFEDAAFKAYCIEHFDVDHDGKISKAEADAVREVDVSDKIKSGEIMSLNGIGIFTNLESLKCDGESIYSHDSEKHEGFGKLTSLDISRNRWLKHLSCEGNHIIAINVENNLQLEYLNCSTNKLKEVNVSNNVKLERLKCENNYSIPEIDICNNPKLVELLCSNNKISSLDLSNNVNLSCIHCQDNDLSEINLSYLPNLEELWCGGNHVKTLDMSNNPRMIELRSNHSGLTGLKLGDSNNFRWLECQGNELTEIDCSNNSNIEIISCRNNKLSKLELGTQAKLRTLYASNNELKELDVSDCLTLECLEIDGNHLSNIDVSKNERLKSLNISHNPIGQLEISKNAMLNSLNCNNCLLKSLNVSKNKELHSLICYENPLEFLYIYDGQSIQHITYERSTDYIPASTRIIVAPKDGGSEGTGEDGEIE